MKYGSALTIHPEYVLVLFTSRGAEIAAHRAALLGELAELSMSLARRVHGEAMAATEPEALVSLSNGFQRVARVVRQSLALQARLERDEARAARDALRFVEAREAERAARRI